MNSSAILGILILFGAIVLMIAFISYKREKNYKIAMEKYERDMQAYNEAAALYGDSSLVSQSSAAAPVLPVATAASALAATPVLAPSPAASEGEVLLSGVDDSTAAMVIAILCDELGQNPATLRFKSITAL